MDFYIKPYFYETVWFYVIISVLIFLLVVGIFRIRFLKLKKRQEQLEHTVKERTAEINQQKEEIQTQADNLTEANTKLIEKNDEIKQQNEEINQQKQKLEKNHKHITDSINYAKRIQKAILPANIIFEDNFSEYFIFFKPRDVVSGDFYWAKKTDNLIIFAVADCTGHGVPGAFMSMLEISFLNEITRQKDNTSPAKTLDLLRKYTKTALKQTGAQNENKDGMDISLCMINLKTNLLQFAGAYNSLYISRKEEGEIRKEQGEIRMEQGEIRMEEGEIRREEGVGRKVEEEMMNKIKSQNSLTNSLTNSHTNSHTNSLTNSLIMLEADHQPIGIHIKEKPFVNHEFQLEKNDTLYSFSDGYADQFGGEKYTKFYSKQFKELLLSFQTEKLVKQKQILEQTFINWKGNKKQIDDVLVVGVKI